MRSIFKKRIDEYKQGDKDYTIGLFAIIGWIERQFANAKEEEVQNLTLEFVRDMLSEGFQAGSPEYSSAGYVPWQNQSADYVVSRIKAEWQKLGKKPNMADIAWFGLPGSVLI